MVLAGLGSTGTKLSSQSCNMQVGSMGILTDKYFVFFLTAFRVVVFPAAVPVKRDITRNAAAIPAFSHHDDIESGFRKHAF